MIMTEAVKNQFNYAVVYTGCVAILFIFLAENMQYIQHSWHHKKELLEFTQMGSASNFFQQKNQLKANQPKPTRYLALDKTLNNNHDIKNPIGQNLNETQIVDNKIFASPYTMNGAKKIFI